VVAEEGERAQALVPEVAALAVCPEAVAQAQAALAPAEAEGQEPLASLEVFGRVAAVVQEALEAA
jgi:hypothetical protein